MSPQEFDTLKVGDNIKHIASGDTFKIETVKNGVIYATPDDNSDASYTVKRNESSKISKLSAAPVASRMSNKKEIDDEIKRIFKSHGIRPDSGTEGFENAVEDVREVSPGDARLLEKLARAWEKATSALPVASHHLDQLFCAVGLLGVRLAEKSRDPADR